MEPLRARARLRRWCVICRGRLNRRWRRSSWGRRLNRIGNRDGQSGLPDQVANILGEPDVAEIDAALLDQRLPYLTDRPAIIQSRLNIRFCREERSPVASTSSGL
ncbi:hypothetical protein ASE82_17555 [Sphingomonas sp. Leaf230]|nr:hypothetical protein ASE82_17555 [Sphingomonas sp. Leaf230]